MNNFIENTQFVLIKSSSQDNLHKSIKYGIWQDSQNKKLQEIYLKGLRENVATILLFLPENEFKL